jgi:hypothetical protein
MAFWASLLVRLYGRMDGLSGSPSINKVECTKCGQIESFDSLLFQGSEPPWCKMCENNDLICTNNLGKRNHRIG